MNLSFRESSRQNADGWWVAPDNAIYRLPSNVSHLEWIKSHEEIVRRYDKKILPKDPNIFEKAFYNGWIRVRMEFDENDMSNLIASVSALDIELLSTLPEQMKDVIASAGYLNFIDMHTGSIDEYDKNEMLKLLHRQIYASFKTIQILRVS